MSTKLLKTMLQSHNHGRLESLISRVAQLLLAVHTHAPGLELVFVFPILTILGNFFGFVPIWITLILLIADYHTRATHRRKLMLLNQIEEHTRAMNTLDPRYQIPMDTLHQLVGLFWKNRVRMFLE